MPQMQWASVSSAEPGLAKAVIDAADQLLKALNGAEPDLIIVFVSHHYGLQFSALSELLRREFESALLCGCTGVSVIGGGHELENQPAIALMGAVLPDVQLHAVHLDQQRTPPTYAERRLWQAAFGLDEQQPDCMLLLADPFSFATENFLLGLDRQFPATVKFGGLASGMEQANTPCLLLNERIYHSGCICLMMSGNIAVETIVAQGCRPIGDPMFANATHENLILELDGKMPRDALTELYQRIKRTDRKLFTDELFIGLAMQPQREQYGAGDFLIRTILGLDPDSGALLVNTDVPAHTVVQLHLRDAITSAHDLEQLLRRHCAAHDVRQIHGALLMSCLGRGAELYGHTDHDSNAFKQHIGDIPLTGLFCNAEIGPVRGVTHQHGYTSVFGLFKAKR